MQRRKFVTKKELTQKLTHMVPYKNKRIIVIPRVDDDIVKAVAEESNRCLKLLKQVKK